jgi:hypothetical protein
MPKRQNSTKYLSPVYGYAQPHFALQSTRGLIKYLPQSSETISYPDISADINTDFPFPPRSLVAAYIRDSGGDTQELSAQQQAKVMPLWCQEHGYTLTKVFVDLLHVNDN